MKCGLINLGNNVHTVQRMGLSPRARLPQGDSLTFIPKLNVSAMKGEGQ